MINKLKPKSEFSKNSISLITGSMIAQAIPAALSPILTRIYTPEDYGLFTLFLSVTGIFATLATARYDTAIIMPKSEKEAINIVVLSFIITFLVSFLSLITIYIFNENITIFLEKPEISNWLYFIPLSVLLTGLIQSISMWKTRKKVFKKISQNMVFSSTVTSGSNLSLGLLGFGPLGLIYGMFVGQIFSLIHFLKASLKHNKHLFKYINKKKIFKAIKKYKKMPLLMMPNTLIDNLRITSLNILVINFFTTAILGQLSLAFKVIRVPMTLVYQSLTQVFFQKIASSPKEDYYRLLSLFLGKTVLIGIPLYTFMYFTSPPAFAFVFGEQWKMAGEIGSILSIWMFFHIMTNPAGYVFTLLQKQEINLYFAIAYVFILFGIFFFFNTGEFLSTFFRMAIGMSSVNLMAILYSLYLARTLRTS